MKITRRRWTKEEEETAVSMYNDHQPIDQIAKHLDRTRWAIWGKLGKLGVARKQASYKTHYRCHRCGWVRQENCIEKDYSYRCPHCGSLVRQVSRRSG